MVMCIRTRHLKRLPSIPVTERALPTPPGRPQSLPTTLPNPTASWDGGNNGTATGADGSTPGATLVRSDTPSEGSESDPLYSVANVRAPSSLEDSAPPPVPEKRFDVVDAAEEAPAQPTAIEDPATFRQSSTPVHPVPGASGHAADVSFSAPAAAELPSASAQATGKSDLSYTVISVREPLAKVREETMRQKPAQAANGTTQEAYYTEVPEEEQMYAEIESGHNSAGSSVTYARIEPRVTEPHPPAPPTVESLKSVAQAHSRQASVTSASSLGAPSPDIDVGSLYTAVDKCTKQRQTIHISEGIASAAEGPANLDELLRQSAQAPPPISRRRCRTTGRLWHRRGAKAPSSAHA
ncbi:hypothetical protein HPB48_009032 [Haemaphysalis longicornis]|uniref:Uncharacterized protein n=1 Tax=Haemaphysalis longicornis TaxID=44386 RepID=A0A9J6H420_HAELO|nr:hypothetical protein HPB48_009032 [Haemaphysalis longicornis]